MTEGGEQETATPAMRLGYELNVALVGHEIASIARRMDAAAVRNDVRPLREFKEQLDDAIEGVGHLVTPGAWLAAKGAAAPDDGDPAPSLDSLAREMFALANRWHDATQEKAFDAFAVLGHDLNTLAKRVDRADRSVWGDPAE
ncbi:hypothetical protein [Kutzneria chonburiensis]|uniref:PE domain-containing protein n=1 Tax=Kutzneria chonburiensis TaxID=1483604 RepID=A0ABV6N372_9PSEU|nr:hypothetical protein [Kutzneria chonburiensis]